MTLQDNRLFIRIASFVSCTEVNASHSPKRSSTGELGNQSNPLAMLKDVKYKVYNIAPLVFLSDHG